MISLSRSPVRILALGLLLFLGACVRGHPPAPEARSETGIVHVVLFWLHPETREEALAAFADAEERLAAIPGVDAVFQGVALADERPIVDASFDLGFVMHFPDEESLRSYQDHPLHHQLVEDLVRPYVERTVIYDIQHPLSLRGTALGKACCFEILPSRRRYHRNRDRYRVSKSKVRDRRGGSPQNGLTGPPSHASSFAKAPARPVYALWALLKLVL